MKQASGGPGPRRAWPAALAAGLVATALTWAAGEASVDRFAQKKAANPLTEMVDLAGFNRILVKNAALSCALQGALLGLVLGLAGAVAAPRGAGRPVGAGLAGLILGGALCAAGAYGLFTAYFATVDANSPDLLPSLLAHAGVAALIGASGGAAFALGLGNRGQLASATLGGLAGAALGAILYELAGAQLFPIDKTGDPVAAVPLARLLFHAPVDVLAAVCAAAFATSHRATPVASPSPDE